MLHRHLLCPASHSPRSGQGVMPAVFSALVLALSATTAMAHEPAGKGIYTCVDGNGRRITSDRPIVECLDREQQQLGNSGVVRRVLPPSYTAEERSRLEAQRKVEEDQRARVAEERRRDRALLIRYPNLASHDKERSEALAQIDEVIGAVNKRELSLEKQRKDIDAELEFYLRDPSKAPPSLRRRLEDNEQQVLVQKRFLDEQAQEKRRVNARFDEELVKLRQLWSGK